MSGGQLPLRLTRRALLAQALAAPGAAAAQGFAAMGTAAQGFQNPDPTYRFRFPLDHGPHPEFRIEWWYITANLTGVDGQPYGIQWTLFRTALAPQEADGWASPQIWIGHAGLTSADTHFAAERFSRGGIGTAGVRAEPFAAWIDEWQMVASAPGQPDQLDRVHLNAAGQEFAFDLELIAAGPLVPQGQQGYSVKSAGGQASHYYSQPFYRVGGSLLLPSGTVEVTGEGWLDREWSSQPLAETQDGWDWISLHLEGGAKLMGFRLRDRAGADFTSATWIDPDGTPLPFSDGALTLTPLKTARVAGRDVPISWRAALPERELDCILEAVNPQAWMGLNLASYWEGPVTLKGSHAGRGYLEMTGYPEPP